MNVVVLLKENLDRCNLQRMLLDFGVSNCFVATAIEDAVIASKKMRVCAVFFDCALAIDYERFFSLFSNEELWFVPINKHQDNIDVIKALNTHRTAYYLIHPITAEKIKDSIGCLKARMLSDSYYGSCISESGAG